jgi:hypothetical protein
MVAQIPVIDIFRLNDDRIQPVVIISDQPRRLLFYVWDVFRERAQHNEK